MACDSACMFDGYTYLLVKKAVTFQEAQNVCRNVNAVMMKSFDRKTILKLETCCKYKPSLTYWVGLEKNNNCSDAAEPYRMVHDDSCVSGLSMFVSKSSQNHNCTGLVLVPSQSVDTHAGLMEQSCNQPSGYACQFNTTGGNIESSSAIPSTEAPTTFFSTDLPTTSVDDPSVYPFNKLIYVGVGLAFLLMVIAVLVFVICTRKNKRITKRRINSEESTITTNTHQIEVEPEGGYSTVEYEQQSSLTVIACNDQSSYYIQTATIHYEMPNVRRPLPRPKPYVYMELDNPPDELTQGRVIVETSESDRDNYDGDYVVVQHNLQSNEEEESDGEVQSSQTSQIEE